ncbi:unnamed protein product [Anisakis simplex]|uniref:Dodecin domain-containing protein n=1 Tax=Anisakis simplex TaxID=6269 RepID=A0A0M3J820_ANISI|nr:unnamed protein product [Anisakis simplex]
MPVSSCSGIALEGMAAVEGMAEVEGMAGVVARVVEQCTVDDTLADRTLDRHSECIAVDMRAYNWTHIAVELQVLDSGRAGA